MKCKNGEQLRKAAHAKSSRIFIVPDGLTPQQRWSRSEKGRAYHKEWRNKNRDSVRRSQNKYHANNLDKRREWKRAAWSRIRRRVIDKYGGKCACCGELELDFLSIEHVGEWGHIHRKILGTRSPWTLYDDLTTYDYPKEKIIVLCFNCNMGQRRLGECPHKRM